MPRDEDDDLYDEEFDFVDEDDDDDDAEADSDIAAEPDARDAVEERPAERPKRGGRQRREEPPPDEEFGDDSSGASEGEEPVDEYGRPAPAANYVVHIYENKKFKRTIERPFTPEEAEAFATEYNRTAKPYGRVAAAGKNDATPKKSLD